MMNRLPFNESLEKLIHDKEYEKALEAIEKSPQRLFDTPSVDLLLSLFSSIPDEAYRKALHKLFKAWVYFLCGENYLMTKVFSSLTEDDLKSAEESSLFYGLKALGTFMTHQADGLRYAQLSEDVLRNCEAPFYLANAKLTHGQLLSSCYRAREAAVEFFASYHLFRQLGCDFLSMVAFINYGLKKHALGEMSDLVQICQDEMTANSRVMGETSSYFNMMKLPLGMAFYELNKQATAIQYLESARQSILSLNYVHMYGSLELYLCYAQALAGRFEEAYQVLRELSERVGKLNSKHYEALIALLRSDLHLLEGKDPLKPDIEVLEVGFLMNPQKTLPNAVLALARLTLKGLSKAIGIKELEMLHAMLSQAGSLPLLQSASLILAEFYYRVNRLDECQKALNRAVEICAATKMSARFHLERLDCYQLLSQLNPDFCQEIGLSLPESNGGCDGLTGRPDDSAVDMARNSTFTTQTGGIIGVKLPDQPDALTARELEILSCIAAGHSNEEIAKKLFISVGTTKWHINNIFSKLKLKRRSQAVAYYHEINKET